jgi:hypothetical protein
MLGSYEALAPLGADGMGEAWRARNTKLNWDVALKVRVQGLPSTRNASRHTAAITMTGKKGGDA